MPNPTWRNWAGNQACSPARMGRPGSESALAAMVAEASRRGDTVRVVGAGHSFTDLVCTDGLLVDLSALDRPVELDHDSGRVTVQAGMPLWRLNEHLVGQGRALANLGDIAVQSVAGAVSTATHGTGLRFGNLATQVHGVRLVTDGGEVVDVTADRDADLAAAARVSLGALGVISRVTLDTAPAFRLHAVEEARPLAEVLEQIDHLVDTHDHFEFFWFPGAAMALTKTNRRTDAPARPRNRAVSWVADEVVVNGLLGTLVRASDRWGPAATRTIRALSDQVPRSEYVDRSDRVFASTRRIRFVEMEYALPRTAFLEVFTELRARLDRVEVPQPLPVECRWAAGDDIPLSTAHGRDTAYVAVHLSPRVDWEPVFRDLEEVFLEAEGRPHWGKLHFQTAATLAPRYPGWSRFQHARKRLDPAGRFCNAAVTRLLGGPESAA